MSIPNIFYKIKRLSGLDKTTIMYLFIIIGVGISSFGLGRYSISSDLNKDRNILITNNGINTLSNEEDTNSKVLTSTVDQSLEKRYVASKNGKMYYSIGCSGAKRIKPENEVWFSSEIDAQKSGYTKSLTCK